MLTTDFIVLFLHCWGGWVVGWQVIGGVMLALNIYSQRE